MQTIVRRLQGAGERRLLTYIILLAVILRLLTAVAFGDQVVELPGTADQTSYHNLALRLLAGHGFTFGEDWWPVTQADEPTAHWSFLYTYYLAGVYAVFGAHPLAARLIQALIVGVLHPLLVYQLGKRTFHSSVGLLGAGLTAVYIYFIYYAGTLMTEPFYITAILASLYMALKLLEHAEQGAGRPLYATGLAFGFVLAATVLFRQIFLLLIPFIFLWLLWMIGFKKVGPLILAGLVLVVSLAPFTIYNYVRFNRFVLLNTNAGYAFFWGNHPRYGTQFIPILPSEEYLRMIPRELIQLDEAQLDQELLKRALGFIADDPARYLALSVSRIPAYFMFWPSSDSGLLSNISRLASFGLVWPFMLAGFLCSFYLKPWSLRLWLDRPVFLLQLFILLYTVIHLLTWALIRYRLPVDAVSLLFAAQTLLLLYRWLSRRNPSWLSMQKPGSL